MTIGYLKIVEKTPHNKIIHKDDTCITNFKRLHNQENNILNKYLFDKIIDGSITRSKALLLKVEPCIVCFSDTKINGRQTPVGWEFGTTTTTNTTTTTTIN